MSDLTPSQIDFSKVYFLYLLVKSVSDITVSDVQSRPISQHRTIVEIIDTKILRAEYPVSFKNKYFKQVKLKIYEKDIKKIESLYDNVSTIDLINALKSIFYEFDILKYFDFFSNQSNEKQTETEASYKLHQRFQTYVKSVKINIQAYKMISSDEDTLFGNVAAVLPNEDNFINLTVQKDNKFCQQVVQYILCLFPLEFLYCKLDNTIKEFNIKSHGENLQVDSFIRLTLNNKENENDDNVYNKGISYNTKNEDLYNKDLSYNRKVADDDMSADYDRTNQTSVNYQFDTTVNSVSTTKSFNGNNITDTILVNDDFYKVKTSKYTLFDDAIENFEFEEKINLIKHIMNVLGDFKKFDNLFVEDMFQQQLEMFFNSFFKLFHSVYADFLKRLIVQKTIKHLEFIHSSYTQLKIFLMNIVFKYDERWEYIFETLNTKEFEELFHRNFSNYFKDQTFSVITFIKDIEGIQDALGRLDPKLDFIKVNFNTIYKANFTKNYKNMIKKFRKRARVKEFEVFKAFQSFIIGNINKFNLMKTFDEHKHFNIHFVKFFKNFVLYLSDKFYIAITDIYRDRQIDAEFTSIKILDVLKLGRALANELDSLFYTKNSSVCTNVMVHFTRNITRDILDLLAAMRNSFVDSLIETQKGNKTTNAYKKFFGLLKDTCNILLFIDDYKKIMSGVNKHGSDLTKNKMQYYDLECSLSLDDFENYRIEVDGNVLISSETLFMHTYEDEEDMKVTIFHKGKELYKIPISDVSKDGRVQIDLRKRKILLDLKFNGLAVEDFSVGYYVNMVVKCSSLLCKYISKEIVKQAFENLENEELLQKLKNTGVTSTVKGLESDYFYNVLWRHYCEDIYRNELESKDKIERLDTLYSMLEKCIENREALVKKNIYYDSIVSRIQLVKSSKKSEVFIHYEKENLLHTDEIKMKIDTIEDTMNKLKKKVK